MAFGCLEAPYFFWLWPEASDVKGRIVASLCPSHYLKEVESAGRVKAYVLKAHVLVGIYESPAPVSAEKEAATLEQK